MFVGFLPKSIAPIYPFILSSLGKYFTYLFVKLHYLLLSPMGGDWMWVWHLLLASSYWDAFSSLSNCNLHVCLLMKLTTFQKSCFSNFVWFKLNFTIPQSSEWTCYYWNSLVMCNAAKKWNSEAFPYANNSVERYLWLGVMAHGFHSSPLEASLVSQWFSTFHCLSPLMKLLMCGDPNHNIISLLPHSYIATFMNHNGISDIKDIWYATPKRSWEGVEAHRELLISPRAAGLQRETLSKNKKTSNYIPPQ